MKSKSQQREKRAETEWPAHGSELRFGKRADMGRSSAEPLLVVKRRPLQKAAATNPGADRLRRRPLHKKEKAKSEAGLWLRASPGAREMPYDCIGVALEMLT